MKLNLNLSGSAEPLINYLKNYVRIRDSLLLEIDTNAKAFVAKTFTEDRSSVRFSSISFDEANVVIVSDDGEEKRGPKRIKTAILIQLPKFIKMIERFGSDVDKNGKTNFDIIVDYDTYQDKNSDEDYAATSVSFKSETLKMKMDGFRVSEFRYLDDNTFYNVVFNVSDPVSFVVPANTMLSIIKTSEIIKTDPRKDVLIFYVDGNDVFVKDQSLGKSKEPNFVYKIGTLDTTPAYEISAKIHREKFITMLDKTTESFKIILGRSTQGGELKVNRILFDSVDTATKIVISIVNE